MNILGVQWKVHDNAAALVVDGELVAAIEEERLTRRKHGRWTFPHNAIAQCLKIAAIEPSDVDAIAFNWSPGYNFQSVRPFLRATPCFGTVALELASRGWNLLAAPTARAFTNWRAQIVWTSHDLAHAAGAYFQSGFDEAAIIVVDGYGDFDCASVFLGRGAELRLVQKHDFPNSLGFIYGALTQYLGFEMLADEYKVMGLAGYGTPRFLPVFDRLVAEQPDGWFKIDPAYFGFVRNFGRFPYFTRALVELLGPARKSGAPVEPRHEDIAASLQAFCERHMLRIVQRAQDLTGARNLCLAGGVALNCVANGKIAARGVFDRLYVGPAPHDAGGAAGAALSASPIKPNGRIPGNTAYLGPGYSGEAIAAAIACRQLPSRRVEDPAETAAHLLARSQTIGWFQGRMEFGPRALGNRSILADPRDPDIVDFLNAHIKQREQFRPFAPAVLADRAHELFALTAPSPHMEFVSPVKPEARRRIPGVTHVDGTARVQTVEERANPLFHRLIARFADLTGVACILNTSFNSHGQPIVCTPEDAFDCFERTGLRRMMIGDRLVAKSDAELSVDTPQNTPSARARP